MMRLLVFIFVFLSACNSKEIQVDNTPTPLISATEYLTEATRELQFDDFSNPGMLWVENGETLFKLDCQSCHQDQTEMSAAARHYPQWNETRKQLVNLEGRINLCRVENLQATALSYEDETLLELTTYIRHQARGQSLMLQEETRSDSHYERGKKYYFTRRGQFNLSCAQCHNNHWGQNLRGDTISQGHGNGFPAYRFEWEGVGSLHRRFVDCDRGVRAEPRPLGSDDYLALEYYLSYRAGNLPIETPAIRR